jgi:hypothetical protein
MPAGDRMIIRVGETFYTSKRGIRGFPILPRFPNSARLSESDGHRPRV